MNKQQIETTGRILRNRVIELELSMETISKTDFDKIWFDQSKIKLVEYPDDCARNFNTIWNKVFRYAVCGEICGYCTNKRKNYCQDGCNITREIDGKVTRRCLTRFS